MGVKPDKTIQLKLRKISGFIEKKLDSFLNLQSFEPVDRSLNIDKKKFFK